MIERFVTLFSAPSQRKNALTMVEGDLCLLWIGIIAQQLIEF
jgi:hypothetical protein